MRKWIVTRATAGLTAAALLVGGCFPVESLVDQGNPLAAFIVFLSFFRARSKAPGPVKATADVALSGSIGGLSGAYDLTLGKYGTFTGTATIGRDRRSATVKAADTPELRAVADAFVLDLHQVDIDVTSVSAKVTGRQTTGGVKKSWNGKIKFAGTVAAGPDIGRVVKGKISSKGSF